ncbi:hypothetical protein [Rhodopila globiformis]|uniref:Uncharacterized protein n=1 Tax=Rhodopila globiformis TaxID=1071 RepID=A0A2S6NPB8_RHOGL|nr:hypothetical protein [Rhodopila globiformis]PPQ40798.1 hypothetical protein CCS01_00420 [Rhodopila globiformis]
MNVTVRIPDDFADRLGSGDLGRKALEALALQEHRAGRLALADLRQVLGFATRAELDAFLDAHGLPSSVPVHQPADDLAARIRAFRAGKTLGGLDPAALIREGRR